MANASLNSQSSWQMAKSIETNQNSFNTLVIEEKRIYARGARVPFHKSVVKLCKNYLNELCVFLLLFFELSNKSKLPLKLHFESYFESFKSITDTFRQFDRKILTIPF